MRDDSEWLTLGQAARFLGVAQSTIRKWSDQGRVPAFYTPGGHRRYRRADLESFLDRSGPGRPAEGGPARPPRRRRREGARARPRQSRVRGLRRARGRRAPTRASRRSRRRSPISPPRRDDAARRRLGDAAPRPGALRRRRDPGRDVQRQGRRGGAGSRRRRAARKASSASRSTCSTCRADEADRTRLTVWRPSRGALGRPPSVASARTTSSSG